MTNYICATCGVQYGETDLPPEHCLICEDERQYMGQKGQRWTTIPELQEEYHNRIEDVDANLIGIGTVPGFAIGQRALLVQTPNGNVLWDCVSLLDDATVEAIRARGGISAIAVSHPHTIGSIVEWSHAFGNAPIYWHADNREWVMREDPAYTFWAGETHSLIRWANPDPLRWSFPWLNCIALARGSRGPRRAVGRRYHAGRAGQALCQFYVQLSQYDSPERTLGRAHCSGRGTF